MFNSFGGRVVFEGVPWKDWETFGVTELKTRLGDKNSWSDGDLLRFLHTAVGNRNKGLSGNDCTLDDVIAAEELLTKSKSWFEALQQTPTSTLKRSLARCVFYQGRDKLGRPIGVFRPLEELRSSWDGQYGDISTCIYSLMAEEINKQYIPGVVEQCIWLIDMSAIGVMDMRSVLPPLGKLISELTNNFPCRAGCFFVFHLSWLIAKVVNTCLLFADAETQQKIQCSSGGLEDIAAEYFDLDILPAEFGGKGRCACDPADVKRIESTGEDPVKVVECDGKRDGAS